MTSPDFPMRAGMPVALPPNLPEHQFEGALAGDILGLIAQHSFE